MHSPWDLRWALYTKEGVREAKIRATPRTEAEVRDLVDWLTRINLRAVENNQTNSTSVSNKLVHAENNVESAAQTAKAILTQSLDEIRNLPRSKTGVIFIFCPTAVLDDYFFDEHNKDNWQSEKDEWRNKWKFCNKTFNHLVKILEHQFSSLLSRSWGPYCLDGQSFSDGRECFHGLCDWHFPISNSAYDSKDRLINDDGTLLHPDEFLVFQMDHHGDLVEVDAEFKDVGVYGDDIDEDGNYEHLRVKGEICYATGIRVKTESDVLSFQAISSFFLFNSKKTANYYWGLN